MASRMLLPSLCRKTRMCKFFAANKCTRGELCAFAHGQEDQQPRLDLSRTRVCPTLTEKGFCHEADCQFAHDESELREGPMGAPCVLTSARCSEQEKASCADTVSTTASLDTSVHARATPQKKPQNKKRAASGQKTRMCAYHQAGHCFKMSTCNFAHSVEELRGATWAAPPPMMAPFQFYMLHESQHTALTMHLLPEAEPEVLTVKETMPTVMLPTEAMCAVMEQPAVERVPSLSAALPAGMFVKNTFIEPIEPETPRLGLKRSSSCPALLSQEASEGEDDSNDVLRKAVSPMSLLSDSSTSASNSSSAGTPPSTPSACTPRMSPMVLPAAAAHAPTITEAFALLPQATASWQPDLSSTLRSEAVSA